MTESLDVGVMMLPIVLLLLVASGWNPTQATKSVHPRLRLTYKELCEMNRTWVFQAPDGTLQKPTMLLDESKERLFIGGRNVLFSLSLERVNVNHSEIHWAVSDDQVEVCLKKGREKSECANYIKLVQQYDDTHLLACGTGAFNPMCTHLKKGHWNEDVDVETTESGRGRSPYDPNSPITATSSRGQLYVGLYTDYFENDAAMCRLGNQSYTRTETYDRQQMNEPKFIGSAIVPDNDDPADDKVYFFFTERVSDVEGGGKAVHTRVARVCANDEGGQRMQVKRWSSFLKTRLICSVSGPNGIDTHFDELEDVFVLTKKDNKNPEIFGLFSTTSNVFKGYAVCVYSMEDIRAAFNGPFAHREQAGHHWTMYEGKVPFPRPGSCASKINGGQFSSSKDFPDEVLRFVRTHPLMFNAVRPRQDRPILLETGGRNFTQLAVDHVEAEDGHYNVLYIGTDKSVVLKYITIYNKESDTMEEVLLEELQVFKELVPVTEILISTKRQQLYVGSEVGVAQTRLHQCDLYGSACADCCLARDPYCAWDGVTCSRYYPAGHYTKSRRFRRQDIKHGNAVQQCNGLQITEDHRGRAAEKLVYGVENNSTLLECSPRSLQARLLWFLLRGTDMEEIPGDERVVRTSHGLLFLRVRRADAGTYLCQSVEHGFVQPLARITLEVLEEERLEGLLHRGGGGGGEGKEEREDVSDGGGPMYRSSAALPCPFPSLPTGPATSKLWYKEFLQLIGYSNFQRVEQYCERVWCSASDKKKKKMKALAPKWRFPQGAERRAKQRAPRHTPD